MNVSQLKYYYGIPKSHTSLSTGKATLKQIFECSYKNHLDFIGITDYNSYLSQEVIFNRKKITKWRYLSSMISKFKNHKSNLLPFLGFEFKAKQYGNFTILNPNTFFTGTIRDFRLIILWMFNNPNSLIIINTPKKNILLLEYNIILDKLITSVEVGNGSFPNKYIRYDNYYYELLDNGWKIGAINCQNNNELDFGHSDNLTCVLCENSNYNSLIESFRNRLTYSTESRTLKLFFKANNSIMGSFVKLCKNEKFRFTIYLSDNINEILSIEIISNHNTKVKNITGLNLHSIKYIYEHYRCNNETWYVIKITQKGNRIAISSPIFVE